VKEALLLGAVAFIIGTFVATVVAVMAGAL